MLYSILLVILGCSDQVVVCGDVDGEKADHVIIVVFAF
jgi:hypothetical protein